MSLETFNTISLWIGYVAVAFILLLLFSLCGLLVKHYIWIGWYRYMDDRQFHAWLRRAVRHYEGIEPNPSKKKNQ
jgi:hypothetical protein